MTTNVNTFLKANTTLKLNYDTNVLLFNSIHKKGSIKIFDESNKVKEILPLNKFSVLNLLKDYSFKVDIDCYFAELPIRSTMQSDSITQSIDLADNEKLVDILEMIKEAKSFKALQESIVIGIENNVDESVETEEESK